MADFYPTDYSHSTQTTNFSPSPSPPGFQDVALSHAAPPTHSFNEPPNQWLVDQPPERAPEEKKDYRCWEVEYYSDYFNVDTKDVMLRMLRAAFPFPANFFAVIKDRADLWGPFWISTTLIVLLACAGNFADYLEKYREDKTDDWSYNFIKLPVAAAVIWGLTLVFPLALWGFFKSQSIPHSLLELICIYGYSFTLFIPASIVSIVPIKGVRWGIGIAAALVSAFFLGSHFFLELREEKLKCLAVLGIIVALQAALAISFILYFFSS
eukprot:TRINITY_DN2640_c0_g1_i1.p1 TRINITY_DN2640_c0_g1~~TRINITY_DN2640_c0_g1_i1.p1  ORF type:complete len:267 (-),score=73.15 TRINITY_DN2640_c0_g1_i1:15-815(-)